MEVGSLYHPVRVRLEVALACPVPVCLMCEYLVFRWPVAE